MKLIVVILCVSSCFEPSKGQEKRHSIIPLDLPLMQVFLKTFRETVLEMLASAWNQTIADFDRLQQEMASCSNKVNDAVQKCQACVKVKCAGNVSAASVDGFPNFLSSFKFASTLLNPLGLLKGSLDEIGDKLGDLAYLLGDGSEPFISSMSDLAESAGDRFNDSVHGLKSGVSRVRETFPGLGNGSRDGLKVYEGVDKGGCFREIYGFNVVDSIIGRKRRTNTEFDIYQCMHHCIYGGICNGFIGSVQREKITRICGSDATMYYHILDLKEIFHEAADRKFPFLCPIQVDASSLNGTSYSYVLVNPVVRKYSVMYLSKHAVDTTHVTTSAREIAQEYWYKWMNCDVFTHTMVARLECHDQS